MTLSALIARVEEGTGPDRELDSRVWKAACQKQGDVWRRLDRVWHLQDPEDTIAYEAPPRYTSSLDAVETLIASKLPGMSWEVRRSGFGSPCQAMIWNPMKAPPVSTLARMDAKSPARALLAAFLRALSALEDSKADLADATNGDRP